MEQITTDFYKFGINRLEENASKVSKVSKNNKNVKKKKRQKYELHNRGLDRAMKEFLEDIENNIEKFKIG